MHPLSWKRNRTAAVASWCWVVLAVFAALGADSRAGTEAVAVATATGQGPSSRIDFNRDIRPILSENCLACHGPDKAKRKAGLRLDLAESATARLESGGRALVAGDPASSLLLKLVTSSDDADRMPPPKTSKHLSPQQVALLREWIAGGAEFKPHWAYLPPERPAPPSVSHTNWARNEIDRFILARLEKEGLKPSAEADKTTLIRRATLDLTGLPPTVEEIDAFLADTGSNDFEKVVDRLLASPAYGEKMAIHWLDLARYADSDGYHADAPRSMWQYRDYVIRSFNDNKPFDRFTVEQLAGDLLPNPTLEQRIATAFNRNGMSSTEGGADPEEYMNKYVTDRVNTFGTVFLGSSTACTECHDHKYDPFTQREYYQLYDFFNRIPERGLDSDPAPPFVKVPVPEQSAQQTRLNQEIASMETRRRTLLGQVDESATREQASWEDRLQRPVHGGWNVLEPTTVTSSAGAELRTLGDLSVLVRGSGKERDTYELRASTVAREITAFRLDALTHDSLPLQGPGRGTNGGFVVTGFEVEAESADPAAEPSVDGIGWGPWSALGPFQAASTKEVFEKAFIPEGDVDLTAAHDGGRLRWVEKPDWKDGEARPMGGENQVTYLHRTLEVKESRYIRITLGSDGGLQAWLNGARVQGGAILRRVAPAPDEVLVLLRPGTNRLLLKVHGGSGVYGFLFGRSKGPVTRYPVEFAGGFSDPGPKELPVGAALDDRADTGWGDDGRDEKARGDRRALFRTRRPVVFAAGVRLVVRLKCEASSGQVLGRFRVAVSSSGGWEEFAGLPGNIQSALFVPPGRLAEAGRTELREYHRDHFQPELVSLNAKLAETRKAAADLDRAIPTLRVMEDMAEPRTTRIRVRGDYRSLGEAVSAGVPAVLPAFPVSVPTNRLGLAKWLVDPRHPLLARVTVNRFWAMYFGTGLVKTGNEFGTQGELPSHPELLDWLAREFIDGGWDIKAFQRRIVLSAAYRQSSKVTPDLLERDPSNRLLARGPRFRLSAEVIRDCALDYAGLLDRRRAPGGPSVRPYQPPGLWEEKMFGGNRYEESQGPDLHRRSLYTLWKRTVPHPTLMTFDAPDRAICTEQRSLTCTPLQAFVTLNEKGFVEAARLLAHRVVTGGGSELPQRLRYAFRTVLGRPPTDTESAILAGVHQDLFHGYQADLQSALDLLSAGKPPQPETAKVNQLDLAAWTGMANLLLNLDETVTKE
jgi:mono/diheme cytochrome c family protein